MLESKRPDGEAKAGYSDRNFLLFLFIIVFAEGSAIAWLFF